MKELRSVSTLEYNATDCIVSVSVPSSAIARIHSDGTTVDINCKTFFSKLQPKTKLAPVSAQSSDNPVSIEPVFTRPVVNRYENIIDQLERKYYGGGVVSTKPDDSSDSDDSAPSEQPAPAQTQPPKRSKKQLCTDDYDMDDPFIDDEEMICEVEAAMKTKRLKTKHDGFFVSSGKLEVLSPKKAQKSTSSNTKTKPSIPAAAPIPLPEAPTAAAEDPPLSPGGDGAAEAKKRKRRRTKKEMEDAALAKLARIEKDGSVVLGEAAKDVRVADNSSQAGSTAVDNSSQVCTTTVDISSPQKPKVEKEKPQWTPSEEVQRVLLTFREHMAGSGIKLLKSSNIPKALEEPLRDVDKQVLPHHSTAEMQRTCGYYEALHSALGGEVNIGKIRSLLSRLRLRDRAASTLEVIDSQRRMLVADLKAALAPCPEKLQPAVKAAARKEKAAQKEQQQGEATAVDGSVPNTDLNAGAQTASTGHADPSQGRYSDAASQLLALASLAAAGAQSKSDKAGEGEDAAAETGGVSSTAAFVRYEWVCNWTRPMKISLCQIEQALKLWVVEENAYREKLTVHDKKYMEDKDVSALLYCWSCVLSVLCLCFTFLTKCHLLYYICCCCRRWCWWRRT